jgi:hypothetical protein
MKLGETSMKELQTLHDRIAGKPTGPKTFAALGKLVMRIEQIARIKNIDLAVSGERKKAKAPGALAELRITTTVAPTAPEQRKHT